jgi:hypothetical protein
MPALRCRCIHVYSLPFILPLSLSLSPYTAFALFWAYAQGEYYMLPPPRCDFKRLRVSLCVDSMEVSQVSLFYFILSFSLSLPLHIYVYITQSFFLYFILTRSCCPFLTYHKYLTQARALTLFIIISTCDRACARFKSQIRKERVEVFNVKGIR